MVNIALTVIGATSEQKQNEATTESKNSASAVADRAPQSQELTEIPKDSISKLSHPDVTISLRAGLNLWTYNNQEAAAVLQSRGFEVAKDENDELLVRKPGEKDWLRVDGKNWSLKEIYNDMVSDMSYEYAQSIPFVASAAGKVGGAVASPLTAGGSMVAGSVAGGVAMASADLGIQLTGMVHGFRDDINFEGVRDAFLAGLIAPGAGKLAGSAAKKIIGPEKYAKIEKVLKEKLGEIEKLVREKIEQAKESGKELAGSDLKALMGDTLSTLKDALGDLAPQVDGSFGGMQPAIAGAGPSSIGSNVMLRNKDKEGGGSGKDGGQRKLSKKEKRKQQREERKAETPANTPDPEKAARKKFRKKQDPLVPRSRIQDPRKIPKQLEGESNTDYLQRLAGLKDDILEKADSDKINTAGLKEIYQDVISKSPAISAKDAEEIDQLAKVIELASPGEGIKLRFAMAKLLIDRKKLGDTIENYSQDLKDQLPVLKDKLKSLDTKLKAPGANQDKIKGQMREVKSLISSHQEVLAQIEASPLGDKFFTEYVDDLETLAESGTVGTERNVKAIAGQLADSMDELKALASDPPPNFKYLLENQLSMIRGHSDEITVALHLSKQPGIKVRELSHHIPKSAGDRESELDIIVDEITPSGETQTVFIEVKKSIKTFLGKNQKLFGADRTTSESLLTSSQAQLSVQYRYAQNHDAIVRVQVVDSLHPDRLDEVEQRMVQSLQDIAKNDPKLELKL